MSPQKKEEIKIKDVEQGIKAIDKLLENNKQFIGKNMDQGGILGSPVAIIMQLNSLFQDTYDAAHNKGTKKVDGLGLRIRQARLYDKCSDFISNLQKDDALMKNKIFTNQLKKVTSALRGEFNGYAPRSDQHSTYTPGQVNTPRERSSSPGLSNSDNEDNQKMLISNKDKPNKTKRK